MRVAVEKGENLAQALHKLHIAVPMHCAGNGTCGSCMVDVAGFGRVKACKFRLPGTYEVQVAPSAQFTVVGVGEETTVELVSDKEDSLLVAVDLGTTTIAMAIYYGGKRLALGFENPQRQFGADVMTRIKAAREHGEEMKHLVLSHITQGIAKSKERLGIEEAAVTTAVVVSANTTMQYLLRQNDVTELSSAPFVAQHLEKEVWEAEGAKWTTFPGISAFVGGDIVSGAMACSLDQEEELSLLLDLGTNGEMLLGKRGHWIGTATAAGPAFEGSAVARQVHAAGVLKVLHYLLKEKYMDETGLLVEPYFSDGYAIDTHGIFEAHTVLDQEDIRQVQMAKAAIRAGIESLVERYEVALCDIKKVYLAGGMGYFIAEEDAIAIGLLPKELRGKVVAVGNASLTGAERYLMGDQGQMDARMQAFCQSCQVINLAEEAGFEDRYIAYMNFAE